MNDSMTIATCRAVHAKTAMKPLEKITAYFQEYKE